MEARSKAEQPNWARLTPATTAANGTGRRLTDGFPNERQPNETPPAWTSSLLADQPREAAGGKQAACFPAAFLGLLSAGRNFVKRGLLVRLSQTVAETKTGEVWKQPLLLSVSLRLWEISKQLHLHPWIGAELRGGCSLVLVSVTQSGIKAGISTQTVYIQLGL